MKSVHDNISERKQIKTTAWSEDIVKRATSKRTPIEKIKDIFLSQGGASPEDGTSLRSCDTLTSTSERNGKSKQIIYYVQALIDISALNAQGQ